MHPYRGMAGSSSISGSMETQGSISSISGSVESEGSNSLSNLSSSSSSGGHMFLRSGALVRLVTPIACGIILSALRLQEYQYRDSTFAHGVAPEGIGT